MSAGLIFLAQAGVTSVSQAGLLNTTVRGGIGIFAPSIAGMTVSAGKGVVGGVGLEAGLGPISVIADVLYAKRTVELPLSISQTMTYLHIPVQAQLSTGLFHISGGLYYAQAIGELSRTVGGVTSSPTYASLALSKADTGAVAGIGVGIPLGVTTISADIRYNLGMKNISSDAAVESKNRSIDLLVGATF